MNNALQKAVYNALDAALSCKVYDAVPQGAAYPYVVIDRIDANNADYLISRKDESYLYLSVWSVYRGQREVNDIMAAMDAALHRQKLAMDDGRMVICFVQRKSTMRDADNLTFQGAVTLKVLIEH
jgi:predicted nucleotidyltransferase